MNEVNYCDVDKYIDNNESQFYESFPQNIMFIDSEL